MPSPLLPRGAFARLGFVVAIALAAFFAAYGPRMAHAEGRGGPSRGATAMVTAPARSDLLTEASRWIGRGNPTGKPGPWCASFVSFVLERTGRPPLPSRLAASALRYGARVANPRPGDLVVMRSHVTFFAGWDGQGAFLGLGGNQNNRVRISRFARRAVIAFVRPA